MSVEYKFECNNCGFSTKADSGYMSGVRYGLWGYFRCAKCHHFFAKGMDHNKYPTDPDAELSVPFDTGGYCPSDETIDRFLHDVLEDGECPKCGEMNLEQWSLGIDGCPICGKELKYDRFDALYSD